MGCGVLLIRESMVTALVCGLFLISLLFPKPLIYYLAQQLIAGSDHALRAAFRRNGEQPYVRRAMRTMTAVWECALTVEAAVRTALAYSMDTGSFMLVSPIVFYGFVGASALWTLLYRRRARAVLVQLPISSASGE